MVAGVGNGFRFWRKLIFVDVLASGTRPGGAIGLSLVIGIVMAEVLRKLGQIKFVLNGLMTSICRIASWQHSCGANWQNRRCGANSHWSRINMAMRRVEESVVNQGWITCRKPGSISIVIRWRPCSYVNTRGAGTLRARRIGTLSFALEKLDNFINRPVKLIIGDKEILAFHAE